METIKKIIFVLLLYLFACNMLLSQTTQRDGFYSPLNRLKFGNYLFAQKDYLRAISEYNAYLSIFKNDTIKFRIAFAHSEMGKSFISLNEFKSLFGSNAIRNYSELYFVREKLKSKGLNYFNSNFSFAQSYLLKDSSFAFKKNIKMMRQFSELFGNKIHQKLNEFLSPFSDNIRNDVKNFYERKTNPKYKSEVAAGVLSAVIPGSGKIYADKIGDGITAFVVTGLFAFLAVDNFNASHKIRAWIFTGLASAFYAGNIYGSVIAAQQYNLGIQINLGKDINVFLKKHNYLAPIPKFLFP